MPESSRPPVSEDPEADSRAIQAIREAFPAYIEEFFSRQEVIHEKLVSCQSCINVVKLYPASDLRYRCSDGYSVVEAIPAKIKK